MRSLLLLFTCLLAPLSLTAEVEVPTLAESIATQTEKISKIDPSDTRKLCEAYAYRAIIFLAYKDYQNSLEDYLTAKALHNPTINTFDNYFRLYTIVLGERICYLNLNAKKEAARASKELQIIDAHLDSLLQITLPRYP
ncbi:MAG: hypothetical protein HYX48_01790 [Chlamydiales bacterium]|nr:hypothetical protein [Chlamydiales bacterium]